MPQSNTADQPTTLFGRDTELTITVKPVLSSHSKEVQNGFQDRLSLNAGQKYCRISTVCHWPLKIGFTVH